MVNYSNGKIYKIEPIVDYDEGDIYIGSTTKEYLSQRMDNHRGKYKRWKNDNNSSKYTSFKLFDKYGIDNCKIILIESCNCNTKDELHSKEAQYIKSMKCVNKVIPDRTRKDWRIENKDYIKEQSKLYRQENIEKIKASEKEYYKTRGKELYELNKDKRNERSRELYELNKNKICERSRELYKNKKIQKELEKK